MNDIQMKNPNSLKPHCLNDSIYGGADPEHLADLCESVKQHGILQPLLVTEDGTVVAGCTRLEAALHVGLREVPVQLVSETADDKLGALLIHSNKQRLKTAKQIKNEILYLKNQWAPEAKKASEANLKQNETDGARLRSGKKTSERIAEEVGVSPRKVEQIIATDNAVQTLKKQGRTEEAEKIEALASRKHGTHAAYKLAKESVNPAHVDDLNVLCSENVAEAPREVPAPPRLSDGPDVSRGPLSHSEEKDLAALERVWKRASEKVRDTFREYIQPSRESQAAA